MKAHKRLLLTIVSLILVLSALALPAVASAGGVEHYQDRVRVPANSSQDYTLEVDGVTITVPGGALPDGGQIKAHLKVKDDEFTLQLSPEQDFHESITIDLGPDYASDAIVSDSRGETVIINPVDGVFQVDHCSRYSGYY